MWWMRNVMIFNQTGAQLISIRQLVLFTLPLFAACSAPAKLSSPAQSPLFSTILQLDQEMFAAFNQCKEPAQLQKHASYFAPEVEFYHDNGGVTWNRSAMLANTEKYVCGNFRRELVPGSLQVYAIKDFGAVAQGVHRFCQFSTGKCEGEAEFFMLWRQQGEQWQITRAFSYGHRASH
jgi:hypothetical protein